MVSRKSPYQFLQKFVGKRIRVQLKGLECYEGLLSDIQKSEHGVLGNLLLSDVKLAGYKEKRDALIRGNSIFIIYLHPQE